MYMCVYLTTFLCNGHTVSTQQALPNAFPLAVSAASSRSLLSLCARPNKNLLKEYNLCFIVVVLMSTINSR